MSRPSWPHTTGVPVLLEFTGAAIVMAAMLLIVLHAGTPTGRTLTMATGIAIALSQYLPIWTRHTSTGGHP